MVCSHCKQAGHNNSKKKPCTLTPPTPVDLVTPDVVRALYTAFVADEVAMSDIEGVTPGMHVRRHGMRAELSENIVKFVIHSRGDTTCTWGGVNGDLRSAVENIQEVKSITSINSPTSFGPTQPWNVIYFLDASNWREDLFIVYRISLPNTHTFWKTLPMNKKETKGEQSDDKRRPRTVWNTNIKPLLEKEFPEMIHPPFYSGTFEGIFSSGTSLSAISPTTGNETALPANL